ncbi:MAG: hypothetical protein HY366_02220 [Candidatus Aenigmarchaeota archaeon]|nr:hypothetical protein [Candidatus Aenigmarchaeota archaeon]
MRRLKASDVVVAAFAFRYGKSVNRQYLHDRIVEQYKGQGKKLLDEIPIRPHFFHGDSANLQDGISELKVIYRALDEWMPGGDLEFRWDPKEYFDRNIRPNISPKQAKVLEEFAMRLP